MTAPLVDASGVVRRFGLRTAVGGVDLRVEPGQKVAIVGANGAGKTTLLKMVAGLIRPDEGEIQVLGHDYPEGRNDARARMGYLGHDPLVYLDLTAAQNLALYAALFGVPEDRGFEELEHVGLLARAHDQVRTFSRGMVQRLGIARMLLHRPTLFLMDEPFSGLDTRAIEVVDRTLDALTAEQGLVFVTHDLDRAARHANRVMALFEGQTAFEVAIGDLTAEALQTKYSELLA